MKNCKKKRNQYNFESTCQTSSKHDCRLPSTHGTLGNFETTKHEIR